MRFQYNSLYIFIIIIAKQQRNSASTSIKYKMNTITACSFLNDYGSNLESIDSPLQLKLIKFLGLKNYMIDNFIFRRKNSKYHIRKKNNKNILILNSQQYQAPTGYQLQTKILETSNHSIPYCKLTPKNKTNNVTIIYAHGNSSDMADSINFISLLSQHIQTQYIVFDYTGYGQSRVNDVGQDIICKDLQILLAYVTAKKKLKDIILWGFSLGTYPVVKISAKYQVLGTILQCPIASVSCLFYNQLQPDMKFREDYFANIDNITDIRNKLLILHSSGDQIIPLAHGRVLYDKFMRKNGEQNVNFIQVGKIKHNSLHKYIVSPIENQLQKQTFQFIMSLLYSKNKHNDLQKFQIKSSQKIVKSRKTDEKNSQLQEKNETVSLNFKSTLNITQRENELNSELSSIRIKILQPTIQQIPGDMHELVVEEKKMQIKQKIIQDRFMKNCFCFSGQN